MAKWLRVFAKYLKNSSTDFHQSVCHFWAIVYNIFEIKELKQVISCCHGNQLLRECLARKHDQSGIFLIFF